MPPLRLPSNSSTPHKSLFDRRLGWEFYPLLLALSNHRGEDHLQVSGNGEKSEIPLIQSFSYANIKTRLEEVSASLKSSKRPATANSFVLNKVTLYDSSLTSTPAIIRASREVGEHIVMTEKSRQESFDSVYDLNLPSLISFCHPAARNFVDPLRIKFFQQRARVNLSLKTSRCLALVYWIFSLSHSDF